MAWSASAATTKHKAPKRKVHTASSPKAPKYKAPKSKGLKSKAPKYKAPKSRRSSQQAPTPERYKEIQQSLASKGYMSGEPSGKWDTESGEALKRFQTDQNLTPDGKLNSLSLIALGLGPKRLTAQSHTPPSAGGSSQDGRSEMIVGVPKEVKDHETRVGLVPSGAMALREAGHRVLVETNAGAGSSLPDEDYRDAGAEILPSAAEVWSKADLVVKVKEPQRSEYPYFRPGLILFTYLHLAPLPELTQKLMETKVNSVAYETIREEDGSLPLLTPMSEVAGRMAVQVGAQYLEAPNGGRGVLLGGVPGVAPATVVILGGGVVGHNSAKMAVGLGAHVTIIDRNLDRLRELDDIYTSQVVTLASNTFTIRESLRQCRPGDRRGADPGRVGAEAGAARHAQRDEKGRGDGGCRHRPGRMF